jgi:DNA repair protein RecN (Recombination protein N)
MPNVRFDIQVQVSQSYFSNGKDEVQFCFRQIKELIFEFIKKSGVWW